MNMYIILSQRVDLESDYADDLYQLYHFPSRYRNQIHKGDVFIYYQGDRYVREHRYYFGTGRIDRIWSDDGENYYASIVNGKQFSNKVPIYSGPNTYYESSSYKEIRKSEQPPWQSSIRPLSSEAYRLILGLAGNLISVGPEISDSLNAMELQLKRVVKDYYLNKRVEAILEIRSLADRIANRQGLNYNNHELPTGEAIQLDVHCREMPMSYSYKAVLILGMLDLGNGIHPVNIDNMTSYFLDFYDNRRSAGKRPEKNGLYCKSVISADQVKANIETNPLKALHAAGVLEYDGKLIRFSKRIQRDNSEWIQRTRHACQDRLDAYFQKLFSEDD